DGARQINTIYDDESNLHRIDFISLRVEIFCKNPVADHGLKMPADRRVDTVILCRRILTIFLQPFQRARTRQSIGADLAEMELFVSLSAAAEARRTPVIGGNRTGCLAVGVALEA